MESQVTLPRHCGKKQRNDNAGSLPAMRRGVCKMKRLAFWILFAVTLAVYAVMLVWTLPAITAAAGGLPPFDMRPGGYGFEDAQAFLAALSAEGRTLYLGPQHMLDLAYPALITLTLFFAIASLLPGRWGALRWVVALPALAIAVFDYLENMAVTAMLEAGPDRLTPDLVATASGWTVLKSGVSTVVMSALLLVLLVHAARWAMRRLRRP